MAFADLYAGAAESVLRGVTPAAGGMLALQRAVGNAAVVRLMRDPKLATGPLAGDYEAALKAKQAFIDAGKKGPTTYNPTSRNKKNYYGGFDVSYDPSDQFLRVDLKGVTKFSPGMRMAGNLAVPVEPSPQTKTEADKINKLPKAGRAAEVAKWHWSSDGGPDAGDEQKFLDAYKRVVEGTWSFDYNFVCTKSWWEDLGAFVDVNVDVVKTDDAHKPGAPYHMQQLVYKVPEGYIGGNADVHRTKANDPHGNLMTVTSADVVARKDHLLDRSFGFKVGADAISADVAKRIKALAKEMPNPAKGATVQFADVTIEVHGADDAQRKSRFDSVVAALVSGGMDKARIKFQDGGTGDAGVLTIGDGAAQTVVAHETGHVFGLDDEYTGGGAYAAGKTTEHSEFASKVGEIGIVHAKSDSIMSEGSLIRRQHYITFLDALKVVTGIEDWTFGDTREVTPPSPYEDAPGDDVRRRRNPLRDAGTAIV